jgi:hypothetical protein
MGDRSDKLKCMRHLAQAICDGVAENLKVEFEDTGVPAEERGIVGLLRWQAQHYMIAEELVGAIEDLTQALKEVETIRQRPRFVVEQHEVAWEERLGPFCVCGHQAALHLGSGLLHGACTVSGCQCQPPKRGYRPAEPDVEFPATKEEKTNG